MDWKGATTAGFLLALVALAYLAWGPAAPAPVPVSPPSPSQSPGAFSSPSPPKTPPEPFQDANLAEVQRCTGQNLKDPDAMETFALDQLGRPPAKFRWRVMTVEDGEKQYRLRLSMEPSNSGGERLELKIFQVDKEGLPDALEDPNASAPEERMNAFLRGKRLKSEIESQDFAGLDGGPSLHVERENGRITELEFQAANGHLACGGEAFNCRCL